MPIKTVELCAGIGGFSMGLEMYNQRTGLGFDVFSTAAMYEIDPLCQEVLRENFQHSGAEIMGDLYEFDYKRHGSAQLICAGYPCQPFSLAGERGGETDDRHVWPEITEIIREVRPHYVMCENVVGHVSLGLDTVLADLAGLGYTSEVFILPACAVDAPHIRERCFILAYTDGERLQGISDAELSPEQVPLVEPGGPITRSPDIEWRHWPDEPGVGRVADGVSGRSHRIKMLGNAIVPQLVMELADCIHWLDSLRKHL